LHWKLSRDRERTRLAGVHVRELLKDVVDERMEGSDAMGREGGPSGLRGRLPDWLASES
jgi:hypothetical protein